MAKPQNDPEIARTLAVAGELRVVLGRLKRRLREELHMGELSWSQVSVLGHLERGGPATVSTLARAEGMRPQSMGATVAVLEKAGLVSGTADPNDGRQTVISLTPACRELIKASRAAREDWLFRSIRTNLTPAEQKQLANAVELLKRVADS
ncbi:MarR family transcriptional regulator [Dyella sp. S184]|jgi:DNA-binding MarR family transcriptional regulator|uniref:MarR family winged helix-turn-helix transcriptional regulator n=1 Tax=Dyella sp. S184 TaxID=1641862 RepID=UPI00131ABFD9|nr:MarR family transcriptional regulator [Dyella sp. S184]